MMPLEQIFDYLQNRSEVEVWERRTCRRSVGVIVGFDEHMNVVFQSAGRRFLVRGDCISCIVEMKPGSED